MVPDSIASKKSKSHDITIFEDMMGECSDNSTATRNLTTLSKSTRRNECVAKMDAENADKTSTHSHNLQSLESHAATPAGQGIVNANEDSTIVKVRISYWNFYISI